MSAFWQNGQVPNDLGATFGDLHSTSNKSIVASGTTNGSVSFTFGMASQYVYADFNLYGSCNDRLGQNYDGVQLVVAAQSTGVTFDIKVQMFADDTCTVVDGAKDVIFHSADINMFTFANQYQSFVPAGSILDIGCSSLYQGSVPVTGPVGAVVAVVSSIPTVATTGAPETPASQLDPLGSARNTVPVLSITLGLVFGVVGVYSMCLLWHRRLQGRREEKGSDESEQSLNSWS
ncbi:hypothetical protein HDU82_005947 [Entophlyctis luteolus]|nr:hypothetical protein HDU82_005943 [Entophlyctis luteolus]KAJ3204280.1 hypothetical protein HDU82_005947 [Entophlyctis luteolus]